MPWIPDDFDENDLPHQDPRPDKPVIPKKQPHVETNTLPSLLPKLSMRSTISLSDEPSESVTRFGK